MKIGTFVKQSGDFSAFIPDKFPPAEDIILNLQTQQLHAQATLALGKLDGITQLLPDLDFFIFMYVRKEATYSSQIEGTRANMIDAIRAETELTKDLPSDVDDILRYINAMNYGLENLSRLPLSTRLLCEIHKILMAGARTDTYAAPGELRSSQNWVNGATPATAKYVPPPVHEMNRALSDFENFLHVDTRMLHLIKTAIAHAQFETIHPFLDGNGRTGRLLITFYLCQQGILERPVLYLSAYLRKHRKTYFDLLDGYHYGDIIPWINFFLIGIAEVAMQATKTAKKITELREKDMEKIYSMGKRGETAIAVLKNLYKLPIINVKKVEEWTKLSRPSANKLVYDLIELGILYNTKEDVTYARQFEYREYLKLFTEE